MRFRLGKYTPKSHIFLFFTFLYVYVHIDTHTHIYMVISVCIFYLQEESKERSENLLVWTSPDPWCSAGFPHFHTGAVQRDLQEMFLDYPGDYLIFFSIISFYESINRQFPD